jgi:excisionase family DNA binding protein
MLKKFYSVKEASKILGVSTNTIYKYLDGGSLKGKRFNDRGRFKIPYSEIEPYLGRETSYEATESTEVNEVSDDATLEKPQVAKKSGSNLAFFESFGIPLMGILVIYLLWSFGKSVAVSKPSLLTDIGSAILGYSDRTYSKFGNLVYQALPGLPGDEQTIAVVQKPAEGTQPVNQNDIVNSPTIGFVSAEKPSDLNYKIADTEGRINGLYANMQVLSSNAQRLLGKSKTLTSAELNSELDKMSQFLGFSSDPTDKGTIFAEINWLGENWDFTSIETSRRAAGQVGYLLSTLGSQSLAAFSKPDLEDLNNLVIETDLVLGAIGNPSDTLTQTTIFGGVKGVKALAQALDIKGGEIDKILGSWDSYSASEKENTIKLALSESLSINTLANAEETVLSKLAVTGTDAELKNSLLYIKAVLEANKIHISQKAGDSLVAPWLDSDGNVRILAVNPSSLISQKAVIKYYLPEGTRKEQIAQIDSGLTLSLDSQKNQYYVEGSPTLPAGGIKTIGLKIVSEKPLAKVAAPVEPVSVPATVVKQVVSLPETYNPVSNPGQVAGVTTSGYSTQNIVIWGSVAAILVFGLVLLVFYLKSVIGRGNKKHSVSAESKETSVLLPLGKTDARGAVSAHSFPRLSFSLPHIEFRAIKKAMASIKKFFTGIISAVRKIPVAIKTGLLTVITSIVTFLVNLLTSIKKFFISLVKGFAGIIISFAGSLKRGFLAIIHAIKAFFLGILSATKKLLISIKSGILAILASIVAFFVRIVTSVKNFVISIVTGVIKLAVSVVKSFGRGFGAFKRAITAFFVKITSVITTFFANIAAAIVKTIISIKKAILGMIISIKTFFLKILSLAVKMVVSIVAGLVNFITRVITSVKKGIGAVVNAVITFIANIISIVTKAIISFITALRKIAISITTFFLKILSKVVRAVAFIIRRILKILTSVAKFADLTLNQMDFKAPAVRKPHSNYRNTATFLLVGGISATISGFLMLKFIFLI